MKEVSVSRRRERKGVERKRGKERVDEEGRRREKENKVVCVFCSLFVFLIRAQ